MGMAEDLARAQEMVNLYQAAELAVLKGKSYSIGDRSVTRADLVEIRAGRQEWERKVSRLSEGRTGPRVRRSIIRDL